MPMQQTAQPPKKEDKKNRPEKQPRRPNGSDGKHKPLAAEMDKLYEDQRKAKDEARKKADEERQAQKQREKEAAERAKHASVYASADEVKVRHPNIPEDLLKKIREGETCGAGKKLLKAWLQSIGAP